MATVDFETKLDDALTRLAQGAPVETVKRDVPEAADLIAVAQRLQLLEPTPEPHLAAGRARLLQQAAEPERPRVSFGWIRRPVLALAALIIVLVAASMMFVGATPGFATPSLTPTYTATPTNTMPSPSQHTFTAPVFAISAPPGAPDPAPAPAPVQASRATESHIEMAILECWKL